jgi:ribosomal protein S18 acetylase RimI-like enzyme
MPSTEKPFHIRDASADELDAISKLTLAVYEQYATIMTPPAWEGLKGSVMNGLATTAPVERIVAEQNGELVGSVMPFPAAVNVYGNLTGQAAISELRLLAVTPPARGRGIGRALVEECIERMHKAGEKELGIHTSISMQAAIHLYESMGFTRFPTDDFQPEGAELVTAYRLPLS